MIVHSNEEEIFVNVSRSDLIYLRRCIDSSMILLEEIALNDPAIERTIEEASDGGDIMIELDSALKVVNDYLT